MKSSPSIFALLGRNICPCPKRKLYDSRTFAAYCARSVSTLLPAWVVAMPPKTALATSDTESIHCRGLRTAPATSDRFVEANISRVRVELYRAARIHGNRYPPPIDDA